MRRENEKLIIDGNAIYELDLECVRRKNQQKDKENEENQRKKNGRMSGRHPYKPGRKNEKMKYKTKRLLKLLRRRTGKNPKRL